MARDLGISDAVIGLTIVAIGSSAPELVTTLVATVRGDRDVGVDVSRDVLRVDLPLAAAVAIVCWPVFRSGQRISRVEGAVFVAAYFVYLATLVFLRA